MKIAILGAGAFGTALAQNYAKTGHPIQLWTRSAEHAAQMQTRGVNQAYLPDVPLDPDIEITSNITDIRAAQAIYSPYRRKRYRRSPQSIARCCRVNL